MHINFLADAGGVRLTKTYTPEGVQPYPDVSLFNSYQHDIEQLDELFAALQLHAERGHCLLKGDLLKPLSQERRAGATDPLRPTRYLVLDLDFDGGFESIEHFLSAIGLSNVSYILHHSSSSGIRYKSGLRAHVIVLLSQPVAPALIKHWLQYLNLTVPLLSQLCQLSANSFSLRWPLDVTTCQNDKLIYIADPTCHGVADPMAGQRFELHPRRQSHYTFPFQGHEFIALSSLTEQRVNELRKEAGLPKRKGQYGTASYNGKQVDYLRNPSRATVTGTREGRGFVYLNLNNGDSWGYYYPIDKPEFLFNFKGEPVVRLRDIDPEYYATVVAAKAQADDEPPRDLRRLICRREWSYEQIQSIFP
jgi:hypothetical protein